MRIEASAYSGPKKEYARASEGVHTAKLIKIVDKGTNWNKYKEKEVHEAVLIWETEEWDDENSTYVTVPQKVTVNLFKNKKTGKASTLRVVAEALLKRELTPEEERSFDADVLIGLPAVIVVSHKTFDDGSIFTKVDSVTKFVEKKKAGKAAKEEEVPF